MKSKTRITMFLVTILMVLAISTFWTMPALADDEVPPPVPTSEPVQPPEEVPPLEAPAPSAESLPQIPEGTEVVITNADGENIPLATQEAADAMVTGDPVWCPTGVAPQDGTGGCTDHYTTLYELTNDIATGAITAPGANGVIWIKFGADTSASPIIIDGSDADLNTWENFSLTLKGGWNGTFGSSITNPATPSTFTQSISIINWLGDITLSDITISDVAVGSPTNSAALDIETTKKITLTNVNVNNNTGAGTVNGAWLDNEDVGTVSDVLITSSKFNNNKGTGLTVYSKGAITLSNVIANGNGADNTHDGVVLDNSTALAKAVTLISGVYEFNNNLGDGLVISSAGVVTLKDIDAIGNGTSGALIDNRYGTAGVTLTGTNAFSETTAGSGLLINSDGAIKANSLVANSNAGIGVYLDNNDNAAIIQPITLTGSSEFKFNSSNGLTTNSNGAITLNNITANNNGGHGASLDNDDLPNGLSNITLTGTNTFKENSFSGLRVYSDGVVAISNITANNNVGYGLYMDNSGSSTPKAVTLSVSGGSLDDSTFNNNGNDGLVIFSKGAITISGLEAQGNGGNGANLKNDNPGAVGGITIIGWGSYFGNNTGGYGLTATSYGAITATNLWAWGNNSYGALLDNSSGTGAVSITGDTSYGNNGWYGLEIHSKGTITLGTIYTNNNNGTGVMLDNSYGTQNVTLNGANHDFNNNAGNGLEIFSHGTITITNLYASGNLNFGVLLDNCIQTVPGSGICTTTTAKAVTLNGSNNTFEWNGYTGLDITSKGIITTNNVIARDNGGFGAYFDNQMTGAVGTINVKNIPTFWAEFARNDLDGLKLHSNGTITVMDLDAYNNGQAGDPSWGYGVYLNNASVSSTGNIILGTSRANWVNGLGGNFLSGLEVYSNGTITLSNIRANGNGGDNTVDPVYGYGALLDTNGALKAIILNGTNRFNGNSTGGLYINSLGAITLNNIEASDNGQNPGGGDGANLDNSSAATPQPVTLKGDNSFNGNYNNGLQIISRGAITVNNLVANYNGDGAELYNTGSTPQNVTLTGFGEFIGNYNNGLKILSNGIITLNNVAANENGINGAYGYGVYLDNFTGSTLVKAVTLNGNNGFSNNYTGGLYILSLGTITLNNFNADNNTGFGAFLDNNDGSAPNAITILGGAYTGGNGDYGLQVTSKGVITINVFDAWIGDNGGDGWNLDNYFAGAVGGITLSSVNPDWGFDFSSNGGYGLLAKSLGSITVSGLDSYGNGGFGAMLNNAFPGSVGTITITVPTTGRNDFNGNGGDGLTIFSNRAITVNNLYAESNGAYGAWLDNTFSGTGSPQNVTINGFGEFYNNGFTGLVVATYGAITVNNLSANDNGQNNFYAEANSLPIDPNTGWGAYLDNYTGAVTPKGITLNGTNNFNRNYQAGLSALSLGAIKLNAVAADTNGGDGVYLNNQWSNAVGGITVTSASVTSWNTFNSNGALGLNANSGGLITLSNIWANGNTDGGAYIETYNDNGPANVILNGTNNFSDNGDLLGGTGSGLQVYATGTITLNNVTATGNGDSGAILDNLYANFYYPVPTPGLKLTGVNNFSGNGSDGLNFYSYGNIELNKVTADNNGANGVWGQADGAVQGNITLTCGSMTNNGGFGWHLDTLGIVTLKGVFGYGNVSGNHNPISAVIVRACPLP